MTELPDGIFAGLPNLVTLTADGNLLDEHRRGSWFDGFEGGGTLSRFEWVGNDIASIDADALDGFTGLTLFYLSYNKLRTLPSGVFDGLPNLLFVSLHFNEIDSLPADLFDRLTEDGSVGSNSSLSRINLNDNNLIYVADPAFWIISKDWASCDFTETRFRPCLAVCWTTTPACTKCDWATTT